MNRQKMAVPRKSRDRMQPFWMKKTICGAIRALRRGVTRIRF